MYISTYNLTQLFSPSKLFFIYVSCYFNIQSINLIFMSNLLGPGKGSKSFHVYFHGKLNLSLTQNPINMKDFLFVFCCLRNVNKNTKYS